MNYRSGQSVAEMQEEATSILHLYRKLIGLRRETAALHSGRYAPLWSRKDILIYERSTDSETFAIALNLTHEARRFDHADGGIVLSTYMDSSPSRCPRYLRPDEGIIIRLN
jgi:glycosidase